MPNTGGNGGIFEGPVFTKALIYQPRTHVVSVFQTRDAKNPTSQWSEPIRKVISAALIASSGLSFTPIPPSANIIPDWPDFAKGRPAVVQPNASVFVPVVAPTAPNMGWVNWPDFAPKKPAPLNFNPLAQSLGAFQGRDSIGWFTRWPDISPRAKPQPLDTQPLAWNNSTPEVTQVWFPHAPWDDFARRAKSPTDPQSFAFVPLVPSASIIPDWPDFASAKRFKPDNQPVFVPVVTQAAFTTFWLQSWSDPVRTRAAQQQQTLAQSLGFTPVSIPWFEALSEPVRLRGLLAAQQAAFTSDTAAIPTSKLMPWFGALSTPIRIAQRLVTGANPYLAFPAQFTQEVTLVSKWFELLSEPVRAKLRLLTGANPATAFSPFPIPNAAITARLDATEQGDLFSGAISQRPPRVFRCIVSIIENTSGPSIVVGIPVQPTVGTYVGMPVAPSVGTYVGMPVTTPTVVYVGMPVAGQAGARVTIID